MATKQPNNQYTQTDAPILSFGQYPQTPGTSDVATWWAQRSKQIIDYAVAHPDDSRAYYSANVHFQLLLRQAAKDITAYRTVLEGEPALKLRELADQMSAGDQDKALKKGMAQGAASFFTLPMQSANQQAMLVKHPELVPLVTLQAAWEIGEPVRQFATSLYRNINGTSLSSLTSSELTALADQYRDTLADERLQQDVATNTAIGLAAASMLLPIKGAGGGAAGKASNVKFTNYFPGQPTAYATVTDNATVNLSDSGIWVQAAQSDGSKIASGVGTVMESRSKIPLGRLLDQTRPPNAVITNYHKVQSIQKDFASLIRVVNHWPELKGALVAVGFESKIIDWISSIRVSAQANQVLLLQRTLPGSVQAENIERKIAELDEELPLSYRFIDKDGFEGDVQKQLRTRDRLINQYKDAVAPLDNTIEQFENNAKQSPLSLEDVQAVIRIMQQVCDDTIQMIQQQAIIDKASIDSRSAGLDYDYLQKSIDSAPQRMATIEDRRDNLLPMLEQPFSSVLEQESAISR